MVIADRCDVDLAEAFGKTMDDLDARVPRHAGDAR
jgi:hypothetical protein